MKRKFQIGLSLNICFLLNEQGEELLICNIAKVISKVFNSNEIRDDLERYNFQTEVCSSALTDVIHAVINGTDGCLFCFGHAGLGAYNIRNIYFHLCVINYLNV